MTSPGGLYYFIKDVVASLQGSWLSVDPRRDQVVVLNDDSIAMGEESEATAEETRRYIEVMSRRSGSASGRR